MKNSLPKTIRLLKALTRRVVGKGSYRSLCLTKQAVRRRLTRDRRKPENPHLDNIHRHFEDDFLRFIEHSSAYYGLRSKDNWRAALTVDYHRIEKALSLPYPTMGFGTSWISTRFVPRIREYLHIYGADDTIHACLRALRAYGRFHVEAGCRSPLVISTLESFRDLIENGSSTDVEATRLVQREDVLRAIDFNYRAFVRTRCSVRQFSDCRVTRESIEEAIELARLSPSACNRQAWHVYVYNDGSCIRKLLRHQTGNRGFSEQITVLLLITADLSALHDVCERNQLWIDGGMFAMSVVYALHAVGLASCCLNLSCNLDTAEALRELADIQPRHSPVMMIGVGHWPDVVRVARSERKPVTDLLTWNGCRGGEVVG